MNGKKRMTIVGRAEMLEIIPVWFSEDLDEPVRVVLPTIRVSGIRMEDENGVSYLSFHQELIDRKVREYVEFKRDIVGNSPQTDWIPVVPGTPLHKQVRRLEEMTGYEFQQMVEAIRSCR
ncbi:MAG: hypothetical protein AB9907_14840 [Flexilinea sp.]